jgi:hypothetical protein
VVGNCCRAAVVAWAGLLFPLLQGIQVYDERIDRLARQHPDYAQMNSFPGAARQTSSARWPSRTEILMGRSNGTSSRVKYDTPAQAAPMARHRAIRESAHASG